jgi:hypothetical protein
MTAFALTILALACAPVQQDQAPIVETDTSFILNFALPQTNKPESGMTLARFVAACEEATHINFTYTDDTAGQLETAKIRLLGVKEVPKEEFYSFFQIMMIINNFVCTRVGPEHLAVIQISSLKSNDRAQLKNDQIQVDPEDLEEYADQPATLISTVVHLPNTDVRQLSNSMRTMFPDPNTNQLLPAGNTNSMIVTGSAARFVAIVRMLKLIDEVYKDQKPCCRSSRSSLELSRAVGSGRHGRRPSPACARDPQPAGPAASATGVSSTRGQMAPSCRTSARIRCS